MRVRSAFRFTDTHLATPSAQSRASGHQRLGCKPRASAPRPLALAVRIPQKLGLPPTRQMVGEEVTVRVDPEPLKNQMTSLRPPTHTPNLTAVAAVADGYVN